MIRRIARLFFVLTVTVAVGVTAALPYPALARGMTLIRDAEVEHTIRAVATPLFEAAGLNANAVDIHLVRDDSINAFVAGGQRLFIHTGLLLASDDLNQVIGVIAHETGHIAGGHLARTQDMVEGVGTQAIVTYLLGMAVAAAGAGDVGSAIALGGSQLAQRDYLSYSRAQEQAADQAALTYLDETNQSAKGLLEFFEKLDDQDVLLRSRQSAYMRTHPLTHERIEHVRNHVEHSPARDRVEPERLREMYDRIVAKLAGFLQPPSKTLERYGDDDSIAARYARAVAYYRIPDVNRALAEMDGLLKERPDDPYFNEMKGQILFENGRVADAVPLYRKAVELLAKEPLLRVGLAQAEIETGDKALIEDARSHLLFATGQDPDNAAAWRLLGIAHGRLGDVGQASLAIAEYALRTGNATDAVTQAERAQKLLPQGSPGWLRAEDVKALARRRQ